MKRISAAIGVALFIGTIAGRRANAANSCVSCHKSSSAAKSVSHSVLDWEGSVHGKAGVTCESCHGGDPSAATKEAAHAKLLGSTSPKSPVYFTNVPDTCGACHSAELKAFKKSAHYHELKSSGRGPNCVTCHGSMATRVIDASEMERTCSLCHRQPTQAFSARNSLEDARATLRKLGDKISQVKAAKTVDVSASEKTYASLLARYQAMTIDWHSFDMGRVAADANDIKQKSWAAYTELKFKDKTP